MSRSSPHASLLAFLLLAVCLTEAAARSHEGTFRSFFNQQQHVDYDRIQLEYDGRHPHERRLVRSLQADEDGDETAYYQPLRFQFDTQALETRRGLGFDDEIDYILSTVLPSMAGNWSQYLHVVPNTAPIVVDESACLGIFQGGQLGHFAEATLYDVDMAVVVTAYDEIVLEDGRTMELCPTASTTLALSFPCSLDQVDRPAVGLMNFCLNRSPKAETGTLTDTLQTQVGEWLNTNFVDSHVQNDVIEVAIHEMGHLLGFTGDMLRYYREPDGTPRTPRPFELTTRTCPNGQTVTQYFPSEETVQVLTSTGGRQSFHVVTPRVAQVARNALNCQSIQGARLDDSSTDCISSHWHERLFFGESMGPLYISSSENVLSALTLALMEDSGFYRVDYQGVQSASYGLGAGCDFVNNECVVNDVIPEYGNSTFCGTAMQFNETGHLDGNSLNSVACEPSHHSWATCDLYDRTTFPFSFTTTANTVDYWSNTNLFVSNDDADSCPVLATGLGRDCTIYDPYYQAQFRGESTGPESRCVNTYALIQERQYNRPACFEAICDSSTSRLLLQVGLEVVSCDWDGQVVAVADSNPYFIVCPKRAAVCPSLFSCPAECSGRGVCMFDSVPPYCQCFDGETNTPGCYPAINDVSPEQQPKSADGGSQPVESDVTVNGNGAAASTQSAGSNRCNTILLAALSCLFGSSFLFWQP